jgi:hypothetical protein
MEDGDSRMIDPSSILALISTLYAQIGALDKENQQLRAALEAMGEPLP